MSQWNQTMPEEPIYDDDLLRRPLPSDVAAERLILGVVLLDNSTIKQAEEAITPEDLFLDSNRIIYDVMIELARQQRAIDPVTVQSELARRNQLERVGGPAYIAQLYEGVPRFSHIENYCQIVAEKALRRRMMHVFNEYMHLSLHSSHTADELLDQAQRAVMAMQPVGRQERWSSMAKLGETFLAKLQELAGQENPLTGLATGLDRLDFLTGGLQPGNLIILGARPSIGKSAFALNIADGAARSPHNNGAVVGIFSMEMTEEENVARYMALRGHVDSKFFRTGQAGNDEWRCLNRVLLAEDPGRIFVDDRPGLTTTDMRSLSRRLKDLAGRLDLIIVDYLQIARSTARGEQRYRQLGLIAEDLKGIGKELGCPVIAASQLDRDAEDRKPTLRDLRESGDLEALADMVWFLHGARDSGARTLIIAKQRNGPLGEDDLNFRREFSKFEESPYQAPS